MGGDPECGWALGPERSPPPHHSVSVPQVAQRRLRDAAKLSSPLSPALCAAEIRFERTVQGRLRLKPEGRTGEKERRHPGRRNHRWVWPSAGRPAGKALWPLFGTHLTDVSVCVPGQGGGGDRKTRGRRTWPPPLASLGPQRSLSFPARSSASSGTCKTSLAFRIKKSIDRPAR